MKSLENVFQGRGREQHQAAEDGGLLRHEQRAKREAADEHRVFRAVAVEHLERES